MVARIEMTDKLECLSKMADELAGFVRQAAQDGKPAHELEREVFQRVLQMGHQAVGAFLELQGTGDLGETFTVEDGKTLKRLEPVTRPYRTVFGDFEISRHVYAVREGQKHAFIPVDQRLQLPESEYSYLLQEWDQMLGVQEAFGMVSETIRSILGQKQPVDSLERMNRKMSAVVQSFRELRPAPVPEEEGEILVVTIDNKGIPMRRPRDERPSGARRKKGEKANKKQMAAVGSVYTVDPKIRTAEELVATLFRERPASKSETSKEPVAQQKRIWSCLTHEREDGTTVRGQDEVFLWMASEAKLRCRADQKVVFLSDGQPSLETDRQTFLPDEYLPCGQIVDILDLMHVIPRLWEVAYLFHPEGSDAAAEFVKPRLLQVLQGQAGRVIGGLRQMGTKRRLRGWKRKKLDGACNFLAKNVHRMQYDQYLAWGLPIATGVIEGACRYIVKDRMERAGMRWTLAGAQAMLDLRTTYVNGQWSEYQTFRIQHECLRLYPYQKALRTLQWAVAA